MKSTFKKVMVSVMAATTMVVSSISMNANAYWDTETINNNNNTAIGETYLSVSSTDVYASVTRYSSSYGMSLYIDYAYGNHDTSLDDFGYSNHGNTMYIRWQGSNFTKARSVGTVKGFSKYIVMNAGG